MSSQQSFTITTTLPVASSRAQAESTTGFQQKAASSICPSASAASVTTTAMQAKQTGEPIWNDNGYYDHEKDPYVFDPRVPPAPNCQAHPGGLWYCPNTAFANAGTHSGNSATVGVTSSPHPSNAGPSGTQVNPVLAGLALLPLIRQVMRNEN